MEESRVKINYLEEEGIIIEDDLHPMVHLKVMRAMGKYAEQFNVKTISSQQELERILKIASFEPIEELRSCVNLFHYRTDYTREYLKEIDQVHKSNLKILIDEYDNKIKKVLAL